MCIFTVEEKALLLQAANKIVNKKRAQYKSQAIAYDQADMEKVSSIVNNLKCDRVKSLDLFNSARSAGVKIRERFLYILIASVMKKNGWYKSVFKFNKKSANCYIKNNP